MCSQSNDFLKEKSLQKPNRGNIIFLYCCNLGEKRVHSPPAKFRLDAFLKQSHISSLNCFLMALLMTASFLHNKRSSDLWIHFFNLVITLNILTEHCGAKKGQLVLFSIFWTKYLKGCLHWQRSLSIVLPTQVSLRE